jgi:hypothetical protein
MAEAAVVAALANGEDLPDRPVTPARAVVAL